MLMLDRYEIEFSTYLDPCNEIRSPLVMQLR